MKLSRLIAVLLIAGCARTSGDGPAIDTLVPRGTYSTGPVTVTVNGSNFVPGLIAKQNHGGGIDVAGDGGVNEQFHVWMGDAATQDVTWRSENALTITVPPMPAPGGVQAYDLKVVAPYGTGLKPNAFKVSTQQPAQLKVSVDGPAQVTTAQSFDLVLTIQNTGQSAADDVIPAIAPASVASSAQPTDEADAGVPQAGLGSIDGGASRVVKWHFDKVTVGTYALALSAGGTDDVDGHSLGDGANSSLKVVLPASLTVVAQAPSRAQISVDQQVSVDVDVTNNGGSDATAVGVGAIFSAALQMVTQPPALDIPSGATRRFTFVLAGAASGSTKIALQATGKDSTSGANLTASAPPTSSIAVQRAAALSVAAALVTPGPRAAVGQDLDVSLTVTNTGEATALSLLPDVSSATLLSGTPGGALAGGAFASFVYRFHVGAPGSVLFTANAQAQDLNSGLTVQAQPADAGRVTLEEPATLSLDPIGALPTVTGGQDFQLTLTARNAPGSATALGVKASLQPSPGYSVVSVSPDNQDIPGGQSGTFTVKLRGGGPGSAPIAASVDGTDADSTVRISSQASGSVNVLSPAQLRVTASQPPSTISVSQQLTLSVLVENVGGSDALSVGVTGDPGASLDVVTLPDKQDIAADGQKTFQFVFTGKASGTVHFIAGVSGSDAVSSLGVTGGATFSDVTVQTKAKLQLTATGTLVPPNASFSASFAQQFDVRLQVKNTGEAAAKNVLPDLTVGPAVALVSTAPTAAVVPGGQTVSFDYTFKAAAAGDATFNPTVSGNETNTNVALFDGPLALGTTRVETQAALSLLMTGPTQASTGESFQETLTVSNGGTSAASSVTPQLLLPAGVVLDGAPPDPADIPGGTFAQFVFNLKASSPGSGSLGPSASGIDADSNQTVTASAAAVPFAVQRPAELHILSLAILPSLSTGQTFTALLKVQNTGDAVATKVTPSISGGATVLDPAQRQEIAGGTIAIFTWRLQAGAGAGPLTLDARVDGFDQNSDAPLSDGPVPSNTATVQLQAALTATLKIPGSLSRGQSFTATLTVENTGEATARSVSPQPDPPLAVDQASADAATSDTELAVDIPGHESRDFTWTFTENGTASGSFKLQAGAAGVDANSTAPVIAAEVKTDPAVVQEPAALDIVSLVLSPAQVSRGQQFTATLTVHNGGEATAAQVAASPEQLSIADTGGAGAITPDLPDAQDISGGGFATFSWTFTENGAAAGSLSLSGGAAGRDANSGASVSAAAVESSPLTVQEPAALGATITAPGRIDRGQSFLVSVDVTNPGDALAKSVLPALQAGPGGAAVIGSSVAQDIAGGAKATFQFTVTESGGAETALSWTAVAQGKDANSRQDVSSPPALAATAVDAPAALRVAAFTLPAAITRGTSFTAQLIVSNDGDATALQVVPSTPAVQAAGGPGAFTSTLVSPVDLPGHQSATFSWTFTENGAAPGTLGLASTVTGKDANNAGNLSVPASASAVPVQDPSLLEVVSFTLPAKLSRGQAFQAVLTVRNTGGSAMNNVTAPKPANQVTGGADAATASAPLIATLNNGQTGTLIWSYTETGTAPGTLQLATVVTGTDAVSHAAVSSNAGTSAAAVQTPASLALTLLTLPSRVSRGQQFTVQLSVQNTGGATASAVTPAALALAFIGGAHATVSSSPPAQDIAGGASATFNWTYTEDGTASGSLSATASVSATDANSGAVLNPAPLSAGPVVVERPAALSLISLSTQPAVTRGQSFTLTLQLKNTGEAAAQVTPDPLVITPAAAATIVSSPAAVNVAGNATQAFSWTVTSAAGSAAGSLNFSASVTGRDRNSNASLAAGPIVTTAAVNTAPQLVIQSFALRSASNGTAINRGETFTADLTVINNGQATANQVVPSPVPPALSLTGGAAASTPPAISAVTLAGGQSTTFHWSYSETGTSAGTIALSTGLAGVDANSGAAVSAAAGGSNTLLVQNPSALSSTLSVAPSIGLNTTFTVSFAVQNTGDAAAKNVAPVLAPSGTGSIALLTSPAAADVAGGATVTFQGTYSATGNGSLAFSASASGADANDAAVRTTSASASATITDAALLTTDPFADGSPFAYVFEYGGRVFIGPRSNGAGAVSTLPDGTGPRSESFLFSPAASDLNGSGGPYPSLGYSGCTANTTQCGPDNENGRADFYAGLIGSTEVLFGAGTRSSGALSHLYKTSQTTSTKVFGAVGTTTTDGSTRGVSSMLTNGGRLYVGFVEVGAGNSGASNMKLAWTDNPLAANPSFTNSKLELNILDGVGTANGAHVQMIDSMIVFNGLVYFANSGGCERSTVTSPGPWDPGLLNLGLLTGPEDWDSCTPSSSQWSSKTSVTTTKTSDFTPADRAVPQMAVFNGRLYLARNTTAGPQLWVCNPGSDGACDAGDWSLIVTNGTGNTSLSTFNDTTVTAISLLAATSEHLYVGYDSPSGVSIFRSGTASPVNRADFQGQSGCPAANHPATCAGLNGTGLGQGLTRLWSDAVMTFSGSDYLYVAAGTGSVGASVYRVAQ